MRALVLSLTACLAMALGACASGARTSFDLQDRDGARPMGLVARTGHPIRVYLDAEDRAALFQQAFREGVPLGPDGVLDFIALSGGGSNGAFTAGLMKGWSETGERPDFEVVTGVSTGALAAPFVFLGADYDDELAEAYTGGAAAGLLQPQGIGAFFGSGIYKPQPLRALVDRYVDAALLRAVAAEYAKGRVLLVATTDLDSQRGVSWDLGAIATQGTPEALELFRSVLVASASIPGAFPPVLIQSDNAGLQFEEMHVDGGVTTPFLAVPETLWSFREPSGTLRAARFYVVINGRTNPSFEITRDTPQRVLGRSIDILLRASIITTLAGNRAFADTNDLFFRYAALPDDSEASALDFSVESMSAVYDIGRQGAIDGTAWR
ncbi:patatin-like phospholipase family protein [Brevundimonas subvibrioides]|uniref:Patatin n=1 Tax=Brevundimonas subvibrioides (strain ATCC 15264 / DSM 4735 / LMG 14903 / NBRC 16000 / CB 81) TaxID=633149 RepID=D9QNB7_BRESC|nr:patatin-like phospholipase family protein [Brevundimonas subvibrioides]ADL00318.1 Patatin [Brevundimonas subvibrioides ATCC 15264]